jgi:regulator of protease activity HflC (stomatin/prohibitin superfamily)
MSKFKLSRVFLTALILPFFAACSQIDTGNVGVESTLGQVKAEEMQPGVHFTMFKRVTEVVAKEYPLPLNDMKPQTSDKITLADLDVDIYMQIAPDKASDIMTRFVGDIAHVEKEDGARVGTSYVTRQAREAIYNAVAKRSSQTVHLERAELSADIIKLLQSDLDASAGKGWFFIRSVNVRNIVTDPALEANIKAAAAARFETEKKKQEIEVAKGEAERQRVIAQGEADAVRIRAAAISQQGGDDYIRLKFIEKWDGKLPTTTVGQGGVLSTLPIGNGK